MGGPTERPRLIKTYSGRSKRRQDLRLADNPSDSDSSQVESKQPQETMTDSLNTETNPVKLPPNSKANQKKVEAHLPPPSPRKQSKASTSSGKTARAEGAKPYSVRKPLPKPKPDPFAGSSFRLPTPDDENSSISEAAAEVSKVRRTDAERLQVLKGHPECGDLETHRVFCNRCNKWLSLGKRQAYSLGPWEKHRATCDRKPPRNENAPTADKDEGDEITPALDHLGGHGAQSEQSTHRTEAERRAYLENDPRADQVLPNEVLCKKCQKWIKLAADRRYVLTPWIRHQQRCSQALPSSRVVAAESKWKLVNDSRAKSFTPRSVECASCLRTISLDGEFALTRWDEHKVQCLSQLIPSRVASQGFFPTATTSRLLDAAPVRRPSPSSPFERRLKRYRETDDEDDDEENEPARNRARTENYVPPAKEAPSILGWFLLPFQTFISGLREGLKR